MAEMRWPSCLLKKKQARIAFLSKLERGTVNGDLDPGPGWVRQRT